MSQRSRSSYDMSEVRRSDLREETSQSRENQTVRHSIHSFPWYWSIAVLVLGCLLFYVIHLHDYALPDPVLEPEQKSSASWFSGERSRRTLRHLTALGPRVVGSEANEVHAPKIIMNELTISASLAHPSQSLKYEIQKGSGSYNLEYKPQFTNIYDNIQNVVAILEGHNGSHSILMNCHYDTVPTSEGASDDGITCAVMLELIRVLTLAEKRLTHNIVFLFNGAEESALQGSHLFLKHKWARDARLVLNLEAAGLGGRAILFQSGPKNAWLLKYYANSVPYPHGQIVGEELFQSGAIPSDTDFRIFRDFGKMPGLDFAFCRNGYVYHTLFDAEKYIVPGSHQYLGDNILALVKSLGHAPELADMKGNADGKMVYYDYLGWFMIRYSYEASICINILTVLVSIFSTIVFIGRLAQWKWLSHCLPCQNYKNVKEYGKKLTASKIFNKFKRKREEPGEMDSMNEADQNDNGSLTLHKKGQGSAWIELAYALGGRLAGMVAALLVAVTMAAFLDAVAVLAMPWYSNVWLIFPLYWCPSIAAMAFVPMLMDNWRAEKRGLSLSLTTQLNLVAVQVPWAVVLLVMTCMGSRSACVFVWPVMSSAIANLIIHLTPLYRTVHKWVWVYLVVHIPSLVFCLYLMLLGYMFFIPTMGRSGTVNGDMYIAVISACLMMFVMNFAIPLLGLIRKPMVVLSLLLMFTIVMVPIALTTSVGHPYRAGPSDPAPQKYWIMHSDRQFYNESNFLRRRMTGYFVLNFDRNSPRTIPLQGRSITSLSSDCDTELYCGLPLYMARMVPLSQKSSWIPGPTPVQINPTSITLRNSSCKISTECSMNFALKGPDRMTLTLSPRDGVTLTGWSLEAPVIPSGYWKGRPTYFLHIVRGENREPFEISLRFKSKVMVSHILDLGIAGNHIHHDDKRTVEFSTFIKSLPDYAQAVTFISFYSSHVF